MISITVGIIMYIAIGVFLSTYAVDELGVAVTDRPGPLLIFVAVWPLVVAMWIYSFIMDGAALRRNGEEIWKFRGIRRWITQKKD